MNKDNILEIKNITKEYPGVIALKDVSFKIERNKILSIVGENGAGKSTLLKIISGVIPANKRKGMLYLNNEEVRFHNVKESERAGIAIIHQELAYQPHLSLTENIFQGSYINKLGMTSWNKMHKIARYYLRLVGINRNPSEKASSLSIAELQLVEIAKSLSKNAKLLILDEPTSSLNDRDAYALLNIMKDLKKQGVTCVFVSHKLKEVEYVSDSITVIRDGEHISNYNNNESDFSEKRLIKDIVGRDLENKFPKKINKKITENALKVVDISVDHSKIRNKIVVKKSSFDVRFGEIIGISGLVGSGRSEMAMNIFGKAFGKRTGGDIFIKNKRVSLNSPAKAIKSGIMYATEDRKEIGLIQMFSVHININMASHHIYSNLFGVMNGHKEILNSQAIRKKLSIKVPNINYKVETLSGGNQQKVLIGKSLTTMFDILIIDEPTKGIDVGSKYEIYKIIQEFAAQGKAIVVISSEIEELLGITDRIFVMSGGQIKGQLETKIATPEKIMQIAIGTKKRKGGHKNV